MNRPDTRSHSNHRISLLAILSANKDYEKQHAVQSTPPVRFNFLRNFTVEPIEPFLTFHLNAEGWSGHYVFHGYGTLQEEVLSPAMQQEKDGFVVIALYYDLSDMLTVENWYNKTWEWFHDVLETWRETRSQPVIVNTIIPPLSDIDGILSYAQLNSCTRQARQFNQALFDYVTRYSQQFYLVDWERILMRLGESRTFDYRMGITKQSPFQSDFLYLYAQEIVRIVRLLKGFGKKCLVLDCDNTLWGGIAGEEGLHGIQLDPHDYPGIVYYRFQQRILRLYQGGVVIALCSKNNPGDVWDIMNHHPHCLLRPDHIVTHRINWEDKVTHLRSIAEELNLGLDSFVFVDDDPRECEMVSQFLPDVSVLLVPKQIDGLPHLLERSYLFDRLPLSQEDRNRTGMYRADQQRKSLQKRFAHVEEYLKTLNLHVTISKDESTQIHRISQLIQKTNQFNLTTKRYTPQQVEAILQDTNKSIYTLAAEDRFGDFGITGVLIAEGRQDSTVVIDSLLLSCRILSKQIECSFVTYCLQDLRDEWSPQQWQAEYRPTPKNQQVEHFWDQFGFHRTAEQETGVLYTARDEEIQLQPRSFITLQARTTGVKKS